MTKTNRRSEQQVYPEWADQRFSPRYRFQFVTVLRKILDPISYGIANDTRDMPISTPDDSTLREVLSLETVAVVGCSSTPGKAAHDVPKYLLKQGYDVRPVNPFAEEIFGRSAVDSLDELEGKEVDIVCIFRPSDEVSDIVEATLDRDDVSVIWTQLGIRDDEAATRTINAGLTVVQNRCIKIEHRRLCR